MKSDSHILILTPGFPEDEEDINCIPPLQSFVFSLKEYYPNADVEVVSFQYPFKRKVYTWNNIPVYAAGGSNKKSFHRLSTWIRVFIYFVSINRKKKVTTIHCFWLTECSLIGAIIGKLFRVNVLATVPGQDASRKNKYLKLIKYFNVKVVCCSLFVADVLKKSVKINPVKIIPYGLPEKDLVSFQNNADRTIDVIGVGNLGSIKNFKLFIEIILQVKTNHHDIKCMIVGDGEQYHELKKLIHIKGLSDNIILTGELKRTEVLKIMNASRILLHTSTYEGQGYVFLEALAYGMQVVAFEVGYLPISKKSHICYSKENMIEVLNGILSSPGDNSSYVPVKMKDSITNYSELYY